MDDSNKTIEVKTFATLQEYCPCRPDYPLKEGDRVDNILEDLGIPPEKVTIIFINGIHAGHDSLLKAGDVLGLFPPVGGG